MDRDHTDTVPQTRRPPASAAPFRPGQLLDEYIVGEVLGEGGMGIVLAARDPDLDRRIAIKVLRGEVFGEHGLFQARARLLREAQAMAKLSHPNVITVYRIGVFEGHTFVAMEYVDGGTLRAWVAGKSHDEIIAAYLAAAEGLAAAHAVGLVHRDFKPDNALVGTDGRVRVTDFGLVASEVVPGGGRDVRAITLTQTGALLGTPAYMAPEQHEGHEADARADQFAFCVSLYEALYGERPFASPTFEKLVENVLATAITTPALDTVPRHVRRTLLRGMLRDPARRFASMTDIIERLRPSAASRLSAIWDADRRRRVREAFAATQSPRAGETCTRVEALLDAWTDAWLDRHAEHVRSIRERAPARVAESAAFLDRRLEELELVIAELERVDAARIDGTLVLVSSMTPVDQLAQLIPLPADPTNRAEIALLAARVEETHAHERFGRYAEGLALSTEIADAVAATRYAPLIAHHAIARARLYIRDDEPELAIPAYRRAVEYAARAGEPAIEAVAAIGLVSAVADDPTRVEDLLLVARSAVARANSPIETGRLELVLAGIEQRAQRYDAARAHYDAALAIWRESSDDPRCYDLGYIAYANYGSLLASTGDLDGARAAYATSREILVTAIGPDHPMVGDLAIRLGEVEVLVAHHARALAHYEDALATYRRAYGERHVRVALAMYNIADMLVYLDRDPEALVLHEQALEMRESLLGNDALAVGESLGKFGMALVRAGRTVEGGEAIERGLNIHYKQLPANHPLVARSRGFLGYALGANAQYDEAIEEYEAAAKISREHDLDFELALHEHALAFLHFRLGDKPRAGKHLQNSDDAWQRIGPQHPNAVDTRFMLAQHLWDMGDHTRARELATAAHDLATPSARDVIDAWLKGRT